MGPSRELSPRVSFRRRAGLLLVAATALACTLGVPSAAQAAGGRTLIVAPSGSDGVSRVGAAIHPLATIGYAIRLAQPGDRIVVRGGTYTEAAGYGARPAHRDAPIRLVAATGQRVVLKGTLQLDGADFWLVSGINVTADPAGRRSEFLVKFDGGTGWRFTNAEVWGTRGVSNLMISASKQDGVPTDYRITGNCIHDNNATGDPFMNDHNIYLMPGYAAGRGVISRNIMFNAENGASIKAAGPGAATGASNVLIENNTIVRSAAGVIISYGSNRITVRKNLIGDQDKRAPRGSLWVQNYRAAVIGNHVTGTRNTVHRNGIWNYPSAVWSTSDSSRGIRQTGLATATPSFSGTTSCLGFLPRNTAARTYGRFAS